MQAWPHPTAHGFMRIAATAGLVVALGVWVFRDSSARAGALADCTTEQTYESYVDDAEIIVLARATSDSVPLRPAEYESFSTTLRVEQVLKGVVPRTTIRVADCRGYKCAFAVFRRGERAIMFLEPREITNARRPVSGRDFRVAPPTCSSPLRAVIPFDPSDTIVQTIYARLGIPIP